MWGMLFLWWRQEKSKTRRRRRKDEYKNHTLHTQKTREREVGEGGREGGRRGREGGREGGEGGREGGREITLANLFSFLSLSCTPC